MARVIGVRDSHSIVVTTNGATSLVELKNVAVAPEEESDAATYLRQLVSNTWVYVDNGDVYRSPDALYVNADMNRHPWRTMKYLGQIDLGARSKGQAAGNKPAPAPTLAPPAQRAMPSRRGTRASQTGSRRSARPQ
jgi:hypothetical protein